MVELTALSSRSGRAIAIFLNVYVSHGSTGRFLSSCKKCYIYLADNFLCCFQQWKNFQNRLTVDEHIVRSSTPRFLKHSVQLVLCTLLCPLHSTTKCR